MIHQPIGATPRSQPAAVAIATVFERHTGQSLGAQRLWRVESALAPLLRDLGFTTLGQLADAVTAGHDLRLVQRVVDALVNHETSFFRDNGVIDMVADAAVAMRTHTPGRRLRIWSAGCSTGQEPLSLAMMLDEHSVSGTDVEIVATDMSDTAIARARGGTYTQFEIQRGLPVRRMIAWFEPGEAGWTARGDLMRRIQYRRHNIVFDPPVGGSFDIVLCRNVLFYFDADGRRRMFAALADAMRPDGLLVLGAGETVIGQTDRFALSEAWRGAYRRADGCVSARSRAI